MRLAGWFTVFALLGVVGCSNDPNVCISSEDCFADEVCRSDGTCGDPRPATDGGTGADSATDAGGDDDTGTMDTSVPDADAGGDPDLGEDTGPSDTGTDQGTSGVCIVDPFTATCDRPDDNDSFSEYVSFDPGPPGCSASNDDFEAGTQTVSNLQMCANETRDRYSTNLVSCDTVTYFIEVTVTPSQACDPDDYSLNVQVQGNDCEEPNGKVQCMDLAGGGKKVIAMVEPSNVVESASIFVDKAVDEVQFDYDLELEVRQ